MKLNLISNGGFVCAGQYEFCELFLNIFRIDQRLKVRMKKRFEVTRVSAIASEPEHALRLV